MPTSPPFLPPSLCIFTSTFTSQNSLPAVSTEAPLSTCAWIQAKDLSAVPSRSECIPGIYKCPSQRLHLDLMNSHLTDNPVSTPASLQVLCFLTDPDWTIGLPCSFQPVGFSWLSLLSSHLSHCSWPQCMTHPIWIFFSNLKVSFSCFVLPLVFCPPSATCSTSPF